MFGRLLSLRPLPPPLPTMQRWRHTATGWLLASCLAGCTATPGANSAPNPSLSSAAQGPFQLHEREYFDRQGANVFVFSNWYNGSFADSKMSGVELVHHGVRTATNGDVRLDVTPEQWDEIPQFVRREVSADGLRIEAFMRYEKHNFDYSVAVTARGDAVDIMVQAPVAVPEALEGKLGFNLEFLPSTYFGKSYLFDEQTALFPRYPAGHKEINGKQAPTLLGRGNHLVFAPEDALHRVELLAKQGELQLYDGRAKAQNGWYVVRGQLPTGQTGQLLHWRLQPHTQPGWLRPPMIAHSQVGYHPDSKKVAVVEQDLRQEQLGPVELLRIAANGASEVVVSAEPKAWGQYTRYRYSAFDFSEVNQSGLYQLRVGPTTTAPFRIAADVYANSWQPTLDFFLPVQMDHVLVNEAYRVWHGAGHLDDARQAPVNHTHFDLYAQGPTTDTAFAPGQHIPGLNVGGWHDAGDYDIRTQSQYGTVMDLVQGYERFQIERDTMSVHYERRAVDLHVADGSPDMLQQVEHGALALIAQHQAVGHAIAGIIVPDISQYTHLGDAVTMTDNYLYDRMLAPDQIRGDHSGQQDDRWAFTSRSSALNYGSIAGLAAASRVLKATRPSLAQQCLATAVNAWKYETSHPPALFRHGNTTGGPLEVEQFKAATELFLTTGSSLYAKALDTLLPSLEEHFEALAPWALRAVARKDEKYRDQVKAAAERYAEQTAELVASNPFGVPITERGWAGNGSVIRYGLTHFYLNEVFPHEDHRQAVFRSLEYLHGNHPSSDLSFVSGVGTRSKEVAYGANRADFAAIPGGIVPGVLILKPDLPENKEDWPFLWGENEYVVTLGASYILLANAGHALLQAPKP